MVTEYENITVLKRLLLAVVIFSERAEKNAVDTQTMQTSVVRLCLKKRSIKREPIVFT